MARYTVWGRRVVAFGGPRVWLGTVGFTSHFVTFAGSGGSPLDARQGQRRGARYIKWVRFRTWLSGCGFAPMTWFDFAPKFNAFGCEFEPRRKRFRLARAKRAWGRGDAGSNKNCASRHIGRWLLPDAWGAYSPSSGVSREASGAHRLSRLSCRSLILTRFLHPSNGILCGLQIWKPPPIIGGVVNVVWSGHRKPGEAKASRAAFEFAEVLAPRVCPHRKPQGFQFCYRGGNALLSNAVCGKLTLCDGQSTIVRSCMRHVFQANPIQYEKT